MSDEIDPEVKEIIEQERKGFDLRARLQGRAMREAEIVIYTDDVTAEALGDASDERHPQLGVVIGRNRSGVLGDIDALEAEEEPETKRLGELRAEAKRLREELESTALVFKLRAVPEVISKATDREARKILGIKGSIPEARQEEYDLTWSTLLLTKCVTSITDRISGDTKERITYTEAQDLRDYLPLSEFRRLDRRVAEVQFKQSVGDAVVSDTDFSRAG